MDDIDIKKYHWLSPVFVLVCVDKMYELYSEETVVTKNEFKRVQEAFYGALMLLGLYGNQKKHYFMQSSREQTPDILTLTMVEKTEIPYIEGQYQTVEIVTYEDHSTKDLLSFLRDTKLSPRKAYDNKTIILCYVNKNTNIPPETIIHEQLKSLKPKPQIVILGRMGGTKTWYRMLQVWPFAAKYEYDAAVIAKSYPPPPHMKLGRSLDKKIKFVHTEEVKAPTIYEVFGIDEEKVKKYLK